GVSAEGRAVIETTGLILEDGFWPPRRANRSAISSLLDEVEFPLETFENIATVFSHGNQTSSSFQSELRATSRCLWFGSTPTSVQVREQPICRIKNWRNFVRSSNSAR